MANETDHLTTIYEVVDKGTAQLKRISSTIKAIEILSSAIPAVVGGFGAAKGIIDATVAMEGYQARLQTTLGSQQKVNQALSMLSDFAKKTPYDLNEAIDAFTRLQAYGLNPTLERMKTIGDFAASMGRSFTDAVEAVADAVNGRFERMTQFGLSKEAVQAFGKNIVNAKGQITNYAAFQDALFRAMAARSGGAMDRLSQTISGKWSNIKDDFFRIAAAIGKGVEKPILNILIVIERVLDNMVSSGIFNRIAKWLQQAFNVEHLKHFTEAALNAFGYIGRVFQGLNVHLMTMRDSVRILVLELQNAVLFVKYLFNAINFKWGNIQRMRDLQALAQGNSASVRMLEDQIGKSETGEWKNMMRDFSTISKNSHATTDRLFKGLNDKPLKFADTTPANFGALGQVKSAADRLTETILGGGDLARVGLKATQLGGRVIGKDNSPIKVQVDAGPNAPLTKAIQGMFDIFLVQAVKQNKIAVPGHN